jgi:hypothetical protein
LTAPRIVSRLAEGVVVTHLARHGERAVHIKQSDHPLALRAGHVEHKRLVFEVLRVGGLWRQELTG